MLWARVISCLLTLTVGPELKQLCTVDARGRLANESSWSQDSSSTFQRSRRGQIATLASEPRLEANPQKGLYHAPNEKVPISLWLLWHVTDVLRQHELGGHSAPINQSLVLDMPTATGCFLLVQLKHQKANAITHRFAQKICQEDKLRTSPSTLMHLGFVILSS